MKALYEIVGDSVYLLNQLPETPGTIATIPDNYSEVMNDTVAKVLKIHTYLNAIETGTAISNKEAYDAIVTKLNDEKIKEIKTIQNRFKLHIDYSIIDSSLCEVEHSVKIVPLKPIDALYPLGVSQDNETVYRQVKMFKPNVEFKVSPAMPYGIINSKKSAFRFQVNNISVYQDFNPSLDEHPSIYNRPFIYGSETVESSLENMGLIYSTVNEGVTLQPVLIPFTQGTVIVSPEIVLSNLVLAYSKETIDNIIEKNIALDNPTVPDPGPSVPPTDPTDPSNPSTTCCSVCSNFEVTDDETDPDALIINIVDKDTTTP